MNKHLNNWFDEVEGKPKGSSNKGIEKERVRQGYKKEVAKKMPKRIKLDAAGEKSARRWEKK